LEKIEQQAGPIAKISGIFITKAWGNEDQPDFYNMAACLQTRMNAKELLDCLLSVEKQMGRIRQGEKWQERLIDIDIIFYNNDVIRLPELTVPHPHLQERRFVLVPLAEIAADYVHPLLKRTVEELLLDCPDTLAVRPLQHKNT
jgi:2-amino-4-hydroxy-6-hydroxymethyldihydropteridine diphosphokinase